ncbi:MAG: PqqD family protein [Anaerolineales bacterium]|nr:PqqD family protein [Anaerolineales bacterium]
MNHATVLKRASHVTFEVVAGEAILIDMNSGSYFSLDEVGTVFWKMLDGVHTLGQLAAEIAAEYNQRTERYVKGLQEVSSGFSEEQVESLALDYGMEEDDVREHLLMFTEQEAEEAAAELMAAFVVSGETVLEDLVDLVAVMQRDNLVVAVK